MYTLPTYIDSIYTYIECTADRRYVGTESPDFSKKIPTNQNSAQKFTIRTT